MKIALLTARGHAIAQSQLAQLRANGVIKKPFQPLKLAGQITTLLDQSSLN